MESKLTQLHTKIAILLLLSGENASTAEIIPAPTRNLPAITESTPKIQPNATGRGTATITELVPRRLFLANFDDWQDDHLHWPTPSSLECFSDGTCIAKAEYLSNMKRTGNVLDTGMECHFFVTIQLLNEKDEIVWASWIRMAELDYKDALRGINITRKFAEAADLFRRPGYKFFVSREINGPGAELPLRLGPQN